MKYCDVLLSEVQLKLFQSPFEDEEPLSYEALGKPINDSGCDV